MELKKAQHPSHRIRLSLSLGLLLGLSQFSGPVKADDFLCDAVQSSNKDLPKLESSCPVGKGIWGKKIPPEGSDFYWIQCGLLPKPMTVAQSKPLYTKITTDVWMKPEKNGYRCLIGPYLDPNQAVTDLREVKTLPNYKEAFIRVVGESAAQPAKPNRKQSKAAVKPEPAASASAVTPAADVTSVPVPKAQTKPAVKQAAAKPGAKSESKSVVKGTDAITVRLTSSVQDKTYVVPYLVENRNQFYMEHGTPWNRFNYDDASQVCHRLGMSLVTHEEFKVLRSSGVMEKNRWPLQLPYWGKDKIGLFADRTPNQLTGTSLLNVLCVK